MMIHRALPALRRLSSPMVVRRASAAMSTLPKGFAPGQMLARQAEVPRLPIPSLESSAAVYLSSVHPLVNDDAFAATQAAVADFVAGPGKKLQERLVAHNAKQASSWLEDFWLKYAYLIWRCPTVLNVNWWCQFVDPKGSSAASVVPPAGTFTDTQLSRAAGLIAGFLDASNLIQAAALPVDAVKGNPLCMNQYTKLFGGVRHPKPGCDTIATPWPTKARHIVVLARDAVVKVTVLGPNGERPSVAVIQQTLKAAVDAGSAAAAKGAAPPVGVLTGEDRDVWAAHRLTLETHSAANRASFAAIDSALFAVSLDDVTLGTSMEDTHTQVFHNHGQNRWFDKPISLVVTNSGRAGVNGEHSPSDAVVPGAVFNAVISQESRIQASRETGAAFTVPAPQVLPWELPAGFEAELAKSDKAVRGACDSIRSALLSEDSGRVGGSDWIKTRAKTSPDSYAQMALQLAYYRDMKHVPATYESASTRGFLHGRTECVRSQSAASKTMVEAFDRAGTSDADKLRLFRDAAATHQSVMRKASQGLGCDRHWLGLKLMLREGEPAPAMFADPSFALSQSFRLSTSNMSPGTYLQGGFGAVTANGYGINYAVDPDAFKFSVSSWVGADTDAVRMRDTLRVTLEDLYKTVERAA
ncbi:acyltransferase ChoActase/COT/CPT [Blastocladiella britannica]|nr:acyltransferase ChoActase/COT/CPT [Blastocladiella britannica]